MLPIRKSMPNLSGATRDAVIAVEVSVPAFGIWFAAVAATVRGDRLFLSTFQEVEPGTRVDVEIALPDGEPVKAAGIAFEHPLEGSGIDISFDDLDEGTRARIDSIATRIPSAPESSVRPRIA